MFRVDRDVSQEENLSKENFIGEESKKESEEGLEHHEDLEIPSNVDLQCEVTAKDANSAFSRAKSPFCKKEIRRLYCLNKGNYSLSPKIDVLKIDAFSKRSRKFQNSKNFWSIFGPKNFGKIQLKIDTPKIDAFSSFEHF